jgi:hypothetical protein
MQRFAMEAIQTPFTPVLPLMDPVATNAMQTSPSAPAPASSSALILDVPMGLTTSHTIISLLSIHHASQEASTFQDSDEMYDLDSSRITRSQALVFDAMEAIYRLISFHETLLKH